MPPNARDSAEVSLRGPTHFWPDRNLPDKAGTGQSQER